MIFVTGDTHGDFCRFSTNSFFEQSDMTKNDIVIICGDFGGIWDYRGETKEEKYWLDWLEDKPFTTCFVDGNHENFQRLNDLPIEHWNGGKIHRVRPSVIHLMRGQVFEFQDKRFFTFGGARSHDIQDGILDENDYSSKSEFEQVRKEYTKLCKMFRIKDKSWWEQELPTDAEMIEGVNNLSQVDNKVDYVISHCLPSSINALISMGEYKPDKLTQYFQDLLDKGVQFNRWFSGHYHDDRNVDDKFTILYEQIVRLT